MQGGVYVASGAVRPRSRHSGAPPSPRPPIAILDTTGAEEETYTPPTKNAAPMMDAACCVLLVADANPSRARAPGPDEQAEVDGVDDAIAIDVETLAH